MYNILRVNFFKMFIFIDSGENVSTLTCYIYLCIFDYVKHFYLMYCMTSNNGEHEIYNINHLILKNYDFTPYD